jgi:hypothetical protein
LLDKWRRPCLRLRASLLFLLSYFPYSLLTLSPPLSLSLSLSPFSLSLSLCCFYFFVFRISYTIHSSKFWRNCWHTDTISFSLLIDFLIACIQCNYIWGQTYNQNLWFSTIVSQKLMESMLLLFAISLINTIMNLILKKSSFIMCVFFLFSTTRYINGRIPTCGPHRLSSQFHSRPPIHNLLPHMAKWCRIRYVQPFGQILTLIHLFTLAFYATYASFDS